ncbi:alcohol dehydrogenase [Coniochaeta ligniaria NRRL 30616]|uniref:Alcohol dehydrogenase n=1 Tax=Coniochaeta ligniaria NRRL 30616 TaxID=1408157 RepID=A0A1J7IWI7_9PEZI|nr:alcohol dehydrogenase [Coniochaeta ligniaria NRRL 30616]
MPGITTSPPSTSKAAVQDPKTKVVSVQSRPTPTPTATQVLVKIDCTGVCASDLHLVRRDLPYLQATVSIAGHEGVGRIAALGPEADASKWNVGDRVAVRWLQKVCKECEACTTGYENLCPNRKISGKDVEGCFAEYALADSAYLCRVPESVSDAEAAPILCAGVTVYKALKVANLKKGAWVAIAGAGGGLGHLAIQYAKAMGYRPLALDANKGDLCTKLGAEAYIDFLTTDNCVAEVIKITDGGAHCALICASSGPAYADAVKYLRRAGTMVCVGLPNKPSPIPVLPEDFIARGIKIIGTSTGTLEDTDEALGFLARGEIKTHVVEGSLDEVEHILEGIEKGKISGRAVIRIA